MNKFLFELGTEEIPADLIAAGANQLAAGLEKVLGEERVPFQRLRRFGAPRRLALLLEGLPDHQPEREETIQGPPSSVAFDAKGEPTAAALGFARKMGLEWDALEVVDTPRGAYLAALRKLPGQPVDRLLASHLPRVIASLSWPKTMYWSPSRFRFIRPLRWFVALWNGEVLEFEFEGVRAGRSSRGHRFLAEQEEVEISDPDGYLSSLRQHFVLVDPEERRRKIARELQEQTPAGSKLLPDPQLEELVTYLNEYPSVLCGRFEERFLEIPQEVLITVMRHHQKYFAVVDEDKRLQAYFLTVLNTRGDGLEEIREGHQRVLAARLEDAAFFWESDSRKTLEERVQSLSQVTFQQELGSYLDKTQRVSTICSRLQDDPNLLEAARLCKADLTTDMVFEMPELQGVMGGLYARQQGLPEEVWKAIYEHYQPVALEDPCPSTRTGALLSLADRLDTLVGCFSLGIQPSGSSDPFALRRQAQGAIRILLDQQSNLSLSDLVQLAAQGLPQADEGTPSQVLDFLQGRLQFILQEQGFAYDVLNAVFAAGADRVYQTQQRARALSEIREEADFEALAVAFKRIRNILTKEEGSLAEVEPASFQEPAEGALHDAYLSVAPEVASQLQKGDFDSALRRLASLRGVVDRFFDEVMVLTEDERLRQNRLRMLEDIAALFLRIADISEIVRSD